MYTVDKLFKEFIELQTENSKKTYNDRIKWFKMYLISNGLNDNNYSSKLSKLSREDVFASLDGYIKGSKIKKQSVAYHYVSVVRSFIDFLYTKGIKNDQLAKEYGKKTNNHEEFGYAVREKRNNDTRLEKHQSLDPLDYDDIQLLKDECYTKVSSMYKKVSKSQTLTDYEYNSILGYTCLRLLCFTGAKPNIFNIIKTDHYNEDESTLIINGYEIILENELADMIKMYIACKKKINIKCDNLFVRYNGYQIGRENSFLNQRLATTIGIGNTTGITKHIIIEMIKKRLTQYEIEAITLAKKDIYNSCLKFANVHEESNRYVNEMLRMISNE